MTPLACPICGEAPAKSIYKHGHVVCPTPKCILNGTAFPIEGWNTRADHSGELVKALEELIAIGSENYDMDMGESGPFAIEQARTAIELATGKKGPQ
jgi:hypothetical protein